MNQMAMSDSGWDVSNPLGFDPMRRRRLPGDRLSTAYAASFFGMDRLHDLLARAGLLDETGQAPDTLTKVAFWHMCIDNMALTNDEANGCTLRPLPRWTWATVFSAVNQMETLGDGLRKLCELSAVIPGEVAITLGHSSAGAHLHLTSTGAGSDAARRERYVESIALAFHCVLIWVMGHPLRPVRIRTSAVLSANDGSLLGGLSRARTRQGEGATLVYGRDDLPRPLGVRRYQAWCSHETSTFLQIVARLDQEDRESEVEIVGLVRQLIAGRVGSQARAAKLLALSPATLRRRLAAAGTSFRALARTVQLSEMMTLLATERSLDDIAAELGLSDRRSLWRACYECLGVSPSAYRQKRRLASTADG